MTGRQPDPDPEDIAPADAPASDGPESAAAHAPEADRRSFLRQLSGDAVWTAGRLAGASAVLRRSLVAAGETVIRDLETTADVDPDARGAAPEPVGSAPDETPDPTVPAVGGAAPKPVVARDPVLVLTPEQHAFLAAGATAALAVNDPSGAPLLTSSMYFWDGTTVHLPARDVTARAINVDRDPRVSLLIEDPVSGASVAVTGVASLVYGERVEAEMMLILAKYLSPDAAIQRWKELRVNGDQIAVLVRPSRFVWRPAG